jgi:hypothetical protein
MQYVCARIDSTATCMFMAPRLRKKLGINHDVLPITGLSLGGQIMHHAKDSGKMSITIE